MLVRDQHALPRRTFLTQLGTGVPLMCALQSFDAAVARTSSRKGRVDVHHHFFPPKYMAAEQGRANGAGFARRVSTGQLSGWTPERSVEMMDKNGIATAIASVSSQ